ncbi:MAG TPA: LON peptidase substrate-binding domain-containing protein [Gemmatimonadaceae bacterium]|nr:LON peptidase substrate-binding domain-containing protein [Gemmatimonadaceae bacterium]
MTARTLPFFPLPVVLFPGVTLPLHIFEPRYRRMIADVMEGDRLFALARLPDGMAERELPRGHVGCVAYVDQVQMLPDGRSNIAVMGRERVALDHYVTSDLPYHVVSFTIYEDESKLTPADVETASDLRTTFQRVAEAARRLSEDRRTLPDLPDDPTLLVFRIAAMIDLDLDTRQHILASRSPTERLAVLKSLLDRALPPLEERAEAHQRAKSNGRGALEE